MSKSKGNILSNSFKTFEHLTTSWKMFFKMTFIIVGIIFLVQCVIAYGIYKYRPDVYTKKVTIRDMCLFNTYLEYSARSYLNIFGKDFKIENKCNSANSVMYYSVFKEIYEPRIKNYIIPQLKNNVLMIFLCTTPLYGIYFALIFVFARSHKNASTDKFVRGKVGVDQAEMYELLNEHSGKKFKLNSYISIPDSIVTRHNFIIGKPGSGKSQLIFRIVEQILERGEKCIIHDSKGDFIPAFYDPKKHYIFNPLDTRHMGLDDPECKVKGWTIFNELLTSPDIESTAASLIAENKTGDPIWHTAPRDLLKSMMIYCMANGKMTNQELYDLILESPANMKALMKTFPEGRTALKHLEDPKLSGQFNSIIATFTAPLQYLSGTDGNFSIEKWIADPNPEKKVIFLSNQSKVRETLKMIHTTFFDIAVTSLCSLTDDYDRRVHFVLEEFGRLAKMGSVIELLTTGRSKGASTYVIVQDLGQVEYIYGAQLARSIANSCGNKFYFQVGDESTAEYISKDLGTVEYERTKESKSFGVENLNDSISIHHETVEKRVALPSEIMSQKSLTFYMQLTDLPLTHVELEYQKHPVNCDAFLSRNLFVRRGVRVIEQPQDEQAKDEITVKKEQEFVEGMPSEVDLDNALLNQIPDQERVGVDMPSDAILPDKTEVKFDKFHMDVI